MTKVNYKRVVKFGKVFPHSPYNIIPGIYGFFGSSKNGVENYEPINEYGFLSNQITLDQPICYDGVAYYSLESFYFGMKTLDKEKRKKIAQKNVSSSSAAVKSIAKTITPRPGWDNLKWVILLYGLREKFKQKRFRQLLLNTGNLYIEETNWWGDCFYGVDIKTKVGFNILGFMLMHVRNEIRFNLDPNNNPFKYEYMPMGETNEEFRTIMII